MLEILLMTARQHVCPGIMAGQGGPGVARDAAQVFLRG